MGGGTRDRAMTLRALFAADCGPGVGLGHLERMLALADALQPDVAVSLILPEGYPVLRRRVEDRGHTGVTAPGETAVRVEAVVAATRRLDLVVLDGYVFAVDLQRRLRERAPLTVVDDLGLPAACDLAVNPSPGGERFRPTGARAFLGGAAFALLREAFAEARERVLRGGRAPRTVLVSTGATDLDGIAGRVTDELLENDPTVEVVRVVGPDARGVAGTDQPRLHLLVAPSSLAEALVRATVYVGAAGTTAVQAACVGVPAVINDAVANQSAQAAALDGAGCAIVVDSDDLAPECLQLLDDPVRCGAMADRGRALVDGRGARRVADAVRRLARVDAA
jgi:spore coat polysaccharide biosynthesis predicted glycosyltransferase SpsG